MLMAIWTVLTKRRNLKKLSLHDQGQPTIRASLFCPLQPKEDSYMLANYLARKSWPQQRSRRGGCM